MKIVLHIPDHVFKDLKKHLLPKHHADEEAAFIFASVEQKSDGVELNFQDWYAVVPEDYESRSSYHFELRQETHARIIKQAHDLNACIIEFHSHIDQENIRFSYTDWKGFAEFVPHVMWRLNGKPYVAVVMTEDELDALAWVKNPEKPQEMTSIKTEKQEITLANNSINRKNHDW